MESILIGYWHQFEALLKYCANFVEIVGILQNVLRQNGGSDASHRCWVLAQGIERDSTLQFCAAE